MQQVREAVPWFEVKHVVAANHTSVAYSLSHALKFESTLSHLTLLLGPCIELCLHGCLLPVLRAANVDAGSICQQVLSSILGIIAADCIAAALGIYCNNVHSGELSSILNQGLILSSR